MGYFANGSEGEAYFCYYCRTCRNNGDEKSEEGCAVWDLHLTWNYDAVKDEWTKYDDPPLHGTTLRAVLNSLIPRVNGVNQQCLMYRPREELALETAGQRSLLEAFDAEHA
jgi:hypothetical protein